MRATQRGQHLLRDAARHVGVDEAGRDRVGGDAERAELARPGPRHADDAGLAGGVGGLAVVAHARHDGGGGEDAARARRAHGAQGGAGRDHRPAQVHVEGGRPVLVGDLGQGGVAHDAGVVDEHVEPAPLRHDGVHRALDGGRVGHVGGDAEGVAARASDRVGGGFDSRRVAVDQGHAGARLGQGDGGGGADPAGARP